MNFSFLSVNFAIAAPTLLALLNPCQLPLQVGRLLLSKAQCQLPLEPNNFLARSSIALIEMLLFHDMIISGFNYGVFVMFTQIAVLWLKTRTVIAQPNIGRNSCNTIRSFNGLQ